MVKKKGKTHAEKLNQIEETYKLLTKIERQIEAYLENTWSQKLKDAMDEIEGLKKVYKLKFKNYFEEINIRNKKRNKGIIISTNPRKTTGYTKVADILRQYYEVVESAFNYVVEYFCKKYFSYPAYDAFVNELIHYCWNAHVMSKTPKVQLAHWTIVKRIVEEINGLDEESLREMAEGTENYWAKKKKAEGKVKYTQWDEKIFRKRKKERARKRKIKEEGESKWPPFVRRPEDVTGWEKPEGEVVSRKRRRTQATDEEIKSNFRQRIDDKNKNK